MDLYHVVLFFHVLGAIAIVGMGFFAPIVMGSAQRAQSVTSLADSLRAVQKMNKLGAPSAVVVLLTGLYMGFDQFSFADAWLAISLALFVAAGAIAGAVITPLIDKSVAEVEAAPAGPVTEELRRAANPPKLHTFEALLSGIDLAIVFLMTNKPGLVGSLVIMVTGLAFAGVRIALGARRHAEPAVTA